MDGLVLNYDEAADAGLIRAADGSRLAFASADWKSPEPPAAGDRVDFIAADGRATEIYLIAGATATAAPAPAAPAAPREEVGPYLRRRPALPWAAAILVSCCLPFLSVPFFSVTLFSLPGTLSFFANMATAFGRDGPASDVNAIRMAVLSVYLLYLIPAATAWLLFKELRAEATQRLRLVTGLVGMLTPFAVCLISSSIASTVSRPGTAMDMGGNPLRATINILSFIGVGWAVLIFASAGLIAVGCGWNPWADAGRPAR